MPSRHGHYAEECYSARRRKEQGVSLAQRCHYVENWNSEQRHHPPTHVDTRVKTRAGQLVGGGHVEHVTPEWRGRQNVRKTGYKWMKKLLSNTWATLFCHNLEDINIITNRFEKDGIVVVFEWNLHWVKTLFPAGRFSLVEYKKLFLLFHCKNM